jgi:hypothetical protein
MRFSVVDALLLVVIAVGAFYLWGSATERARLGSEAERLRLLTGDLRPADPAKVYIRAIPTGDPLDFAWRVYFPPNYSMYARHSSGSFSSGSSSDAVHSIFRVRLRKVNGSWRIYERMHHSSALSSVNHRLAKYLDGHEEQIVVEQRGSETLEEIEPDQEFTLLRLTLPEDVAAEAKKELLGDRTEELEPVFEMTISPR